MIAAALRPLIREALIAHYAWALREMSSLHPDIPYVVMRLRDLRAEREASNSIYRRAIKWL